MNQVINEAPVGVWMWLVIVVLFNAIWIGMDFWLHAHGYELLTTEFKEGLRHPLWGPLLAFATFGTAAAFVFHMFFS
jgi:hypothetical protein